jgi:DNA repair exonuclease SbcCD ATPase subunit
MSAPANVYGDATVIPMPPPVHRPSVGAARKALKEKLGKATQCQASVASLEAAAKRADELLLQTEDALSVADNLLAEAKVAHGAGMAEQLAKGVPPPLTSREINAARAKVQEAEDQRDAARTAYQHIEQQLNEAKAQLAIYASVHYEMRDLVGDEVEKLYEQTQRKLLDLARHRAALAYCLRIGLCRNAREVNHLMDVLKFQVQDSSAVQGLEWARAVDLREWIADIEKMKTDPDAKFPVIK